MFCYTANSGNHRRLQLETFHIMHARRAVLSRQIGKEPIPIVIIDDTSSLLTLASRVLEFNGYRCYGCMDSRLALQMLRGIQPELVILDLQMPAPSGDELLRAIRELPMLTQVPVLLVSGNSERLREYQGRGELQPFGVLAKPFSHDALLASIGQLLADRQQA
jgi:CheY-like chemotaxis protein